MFELIMLLGFLYAATSQLQTRKRHNPKEATKVPQRLRSKAGASKGTHRQAMCASKNRENYLIKAA